MKKNILLYVSAVLFPLCMQAQINFVSSPITARGGANNALATNWEAIGINPSNLGWNENNDFSVSLLNIGISAQADQLNIPAIGKMISGDTNLLKQLAGSPGGVNIYANVIWAAVSFKLPVIGGAVALSLDDKGYGNITVSPNINSFTDFKTAYAGIASTAFTAKTAQAASHNVNINSADSVTQLNNLFSSFNGTSVSFYEYREISLAYGRKVYQFGDNSDSGFSAFKFYGGFDVRYIMGIANLNGQFANNTISANYASVSSNQVTSLFPSSAPGQGYGIDLGLSMAWKNWKFAASVSDLGAITWKGTHSSLSDTTVVNRILQDRNDSNLNNVNNYVQSTSTKYVTQLPTKLRLGAAYSVDKYLTLAADFIAPLNTVPGNLTSPYYAIAAHLTPVKMLTFDIGLATVKNYGLAMPFGLTVGHRVQIYFAVNDILSFMGKTKQDDLSAVIGLLRINL